MTVLGNIVAVTSIIAVVSMIQGLNASVKQAILNQAGADSFSIQQFPITRSDEEFDKVRGNPRITMDDMRAIRRYGSDLIAAVMADSGSRGRITYRDKSIDNMRVQGVSPEYVTFSSFDAERGRLMSPIEVESSRPVAVIGWQAADRLFGSDIDPIDKTIQIEGVHFRVIGVSAKRGSLLGQTQDEFAIMPLGQFRMIFGARRSLSLSVRPRDLAQIAPAIDEATLAMRAARRLKPKQGDNFGVFTSDTILDIYHSATNGIFAVLVGVVGLSLVVGGIVIMNIMLVSVTERTREIGIRKALGARREDVLLQFLIESVVLALLGGALGVIGGVLIAEIVTALIGMPSSIKLWAVIAGLTVAASVGVFFGVYPARKAAKLDPIVALRFEM
jgi:putative ABC transport system permease protein